jgi:outer membrane immunogenic protein
MPRRAVAYEPAFSWTGFYFGANAGYSWGRADTDLAGSSSTRTRLIRDFGGANTLVSDNTTAGPAFIAGATADVDGWLGGGQIGYNWQAHRWVFGIEADIQATSEDGGVAFCSTVACGAGSAFATASYKLDWFGTVRGRLGHLLAPHALLYVTGGLAYGHLDADYTAGLVGGPSGVFSGDKTKAGWVIGGGAEWAIDRNWLLRAEYLYMDLGDIASAGGSATSTTIIPPFGNQPFTTVIDTTANAALRTEFTDHIFRVGLSYKFGCCAYAAPLK